MIEQFINMIGRTITKIDGQVGDEEMIFHANDGSIFKFYHYQDCCESVAIEDIVGDINDLINSAIIIAESVDNIDPPDEFNENDYESCQWTFYKFATIKGNITVRWFGMSNGYYSTGVSYDEKL